MKRRACPPVATLALLAVVCFVYATELAGDGLAICREFGLTPSHPTVVGLFASMVLHDPASWQHVLGNAVMLLAAGVTVERALGHLRLLTLFAAAGIGGALMHVAADPTSVTPMVGSSAAVFGILASLGMLYPRTVGFVATCAAWNIWQTVTGSAGQVATAAHLGGFAMGALLTAIVFSRQLAEIRGWRRAPRSARAVAAAPW